MVVVEGLMKRTPQTAQIDQIDDGAWLRRALVATSRDVTKQPTPEAIGRMRGRLMAQLKRPIKAAA